MKMLDKLGEKFAHLTRRGFLTTTAALGASAVGYGCSKDDGDTEYIYQDSRDQEDYTPDAIYPGSGGHNCGGARCLTMAHVKNGRIIRLVSDEINYVDGAAQNPDSYNNTRSLACSKCRAYKFRIYHPGRLKYPLKQTKTRGDLSGFVRMDWEDALEEIVTKHQAIIKKYGPESIYSVYACGSYSGLYQGGSFGGLWSGNGTTCLPLNMVGSHSPYYNNYSFHQRGFVNGVHTGYPTYTTSTNDIAGVVNTVVLWGSNILSTVNYAAHPTIQGLKRVRNRGGEVIFIGPEFVDQGVTCASKWIQMKPYTDTALILAMIHEMLVKTFDEDGNLLPNPLLDVDYLDTMLYGFFDSPKYWINGAVYYSDDNETATASPDRGIIYMNSSEVAIFDYEQLDSVYINDSGDIRTSSASGYTLYKCFRDNNTGRYAYTNYEAPVMEVNAVEAGKSLSAYILGDESADTGKTSPYNRLTAAFYNNGDDDNYIASKFSGLPRNGKVCDYQAKLGAATQYKRKADYQTPKSPEWAEKITGIPAQTIRDLAAMYCDEDAHPIYSEWCGAQQKQSEGVINIFALEILSLVTKTFGRTGETIGRAGMGATSTAVGAKDQLPAPDIIRNSYPSIASTTPIASCAMWHNAIKFAFGDVLKSNNYEAKYIPDWDVSDIGIGKVYHDDGGVKALLKWERSESGVAQRDPVTGYYKPATNPDGKVIYAGYRFIINSGGNILMNQHMNSNDSKEMFEKIPVGTRDPSNPDDLCIVSFDNFLSPSPRWSDYVLPAATQWEQDNRLSLSFGNPIFVPVVSPPPGLSKSTFDFTRAFLEAYEKIDSSKAGLALEYTGRDDANAEPIPGDSYYDKFKRAYEKDSNTYNNPASKFYQVPFEEALQIQYTPRKPVDMNPTSTISKSKLRLDMEAYLDPARTDRTTSPFFPGLATPGSTGYGGAYPYEVEKTIPHQSGRFHAYSEKMVWQYVNRFSAWHGHLPVQEQGQKHLDFEGDDIVYPIPMYFAYEDYFMEAYGGLDKLPAQPLLLTTTHDRHRPHSSQAETPYLRELTHRTYQGELYSGNDWGTYALAEEENGTIPRLNKSIAEKDRSRASWSEMWMNDEDAANRDIADGDLVLVENPIGAVRVIARVTKRCVKGMVGLHQGCWYDPDPVDGVDDGGNCNTLMASKPSRVDHGNGQQSAMVSVTKVTW